MILLNCHSNPPVVRNRRPHYVPPVEFDSDDIQSPLTAIKMGDTSRRPGFAHYSDSLVRLPVGHHMPSPNRSYRDIWGAPRVDSRSRVLYAVLLVYWGLIHLIIDHRLICSSFGVGVIVLRARLHIKVQTATRLSATT